MRIVLLLTFFIYSIITTGQVYRLKQPLFFHGQIYNAYLNVDNGTENADKKIILSINFYMLCSDKGNFKSFESAGAFQHIKKIFSGENRKKLEILPALSTMGNIGLAKFFKCSAGISDDKVEINLSDSIENNTLAITFIKVKSPLLSVNEGDILPDSYMDDDYVNYLKSTASINKGEQTTNVSGIACNYAPCYTGNIDSKEFPLNKNLYDLLSSNNDFIFKLTMDLYLDILRFKANMFDYEEDQIKTFLLTHDVRYLQYEKNKTVLDTKIKACIQLLKEAAKKVNLGDIFYKDYTINLNQVDLAARPFVFVSSTEKDDYYNTKKVKGEADAFYKMNGLNVYLTNWESLRSLNLSESETSPFLTRIAQSSKPVTLRIYFLLQPLPAYSEVGDFRGVTAYGLKALLYSSCAREPLLLQDNMYLNNISDSVVKRCYLSGVKFLNNFLLKQDWNTKANIAMLYENNFDELGNWQQSFPECEIAYNYLAGQIKKLPGDERLLSLRMMTNYNTTFQAGYEVIFSNTTNGATYKLPIADATIKLTGTKGGYYNLQIKIPAITYTKMIASGINNISFQCTGEPVYLVPHDYFYYNPNEVIKQDIETVQASFAGSGIQKIMGLLKKGL